MLNMLAGPVFGPEDTPALLLVFLIAGLPYLFLAASTALLIRDLIKRRLHRSTIVILGITALVAVLTYATRGIF